MKEIEINYLNELEIQKIKKKKLIKIIIMKKN